MEISVKNLGVLKEATFTLNDLTIICGENGTGKTYAAYALYSFLVFINSGSSVVPISDKDIRQLLDNGSIEWNIQEYINSAPIILKQICEKYTACLHKYFASPEEHFSGSSFVVKIDTDDIHPLVDDMDQDIESLRKIRGRTMFALAVNSDARHISASLFVDKKQCRNSRGLSASIRRIIGESIKRILFKESFPMPFIASAERTGAIVFRKDLSLARDELLEEMQRGLKSLGRIRAFSQGYSEYPLPIEENIRFARYPDNFSTRNSFIAKKHPEILEEFSDIIGGSYTLTEQDKLHYVPKDKQIKLTMTESSSAVRSLLNVAFYLRHAAQPGELLMIDEPELNLHPKNQRRLARLFARLVNIGIKVFVTTHSDYIIKELNTLIMLNLNDERLKALAEREGYKQSEFMDYKKVSVYIAKDSTLVPADIDPEAGIEVSSFDETIEDMNRIQEEIFWGDGE